ncbi:acylphosphatase [Prauserella isguenensis]|uniref:acylphosphatase n=2 Tax=Prauserella isguenensis TaxID=1470180 RepID=A0A839S6I7_9PSEU|nr:acylphosphatase [Prauserella isguenensis]
MGERDDTVGTGAGMNDVDANAGAGDAGACDTVRLTAWVHGAVQGVGFRWWTRSRALELELVGSAANLSDGRVQVVAEGPRERCERLLEALRGGRTPGSVEHVAELWAEAKGGLSGFVER